EAMHKRRVAELDSVVNGVTDALRNLRVQPRRLGNQELAALFFAHLNPTHSRSSPAPEIEAASKLGVSLRSLLCRSAAQHDFDALDLDGYRYRAVNLLILPEDVQVASLHNMLGELWPDFDL